MSTSNDIFRVSGSFRDSSGYVFKNGRGEILRTVNSSYLDNYELFQSSGLKDKLIKSKLLIPFKECTGKQFDNSPKNLKVEKIPFISYPYEWSFDQLKDAALLTLKIQKLALKHNMMLKDASAYNVQFHHGKAIFIDLLSFETADDKPWPAYGQFCFHFLAPLALMAKTDIDLNLFLTQFIDGIPLELAAKLLPLRTRFSPGLLLHLFSHAKMQSKHNSSEKSAAKANSSKISVKNKILLAEHLISIIRSFKLHTFKQTEWGDYYNNTNYDDKAFSSKRKIIEETLTDIKPEMTLDIGANTGIFSRLALSNSKLVVAVDIDPVAIDKHYLFLKKEKIANVLPLRINFSNPSPAIGWDNQERESFLSRCNFDLVMALALVHHLAISNNVPLEMLASTLAKTGKHLIIEFIPKEDSQVKILLASRKDVFPDYHVDGFVQAFEKYFKLLKRAPVEGSKRELFLFEVIEK